MDLEIITRQVSDGLNDLVSSSKLSPGELLVVGCSTSAIGGYYIGTNSSSKIAGAVMEALLPVAREKGFYLCIQCCEHLNRALIIEREAMRRYGFSEVCVVPWLRAGGAMAELALDAFDDAVPVEDIRAQAAAGMDIGGTFIGMHMRPVVVPMHSEHRRVGEAVLSMALTRPKYVGGPRARYPQINGH